MMSFERYSLMMTTYDQEDDGLQGRYVARHEVVVWRKRFRSQRRAVNCAVRSIKRRLQPLEDLPPEFRMTMTHGSDAVQIALPEVMIRESILGAPRLLAARRYEVTPPSA